tara:strand:+ start:51 stop:665 length:615 start_codon:yes stop_codon:yes gene_type:complete
MFILGAKSVKTYIDAAMGKVQDDQTFAAKSHQKEALGYLNGAYEILRKENHKWHFANREAWGEEKFDAAYWGTPFDLHQIRDKHMQFFDTAHHGDINELITLRVLLKELEVVKPAPKTDRITAKQAEVTEAVEDLLNRRMAQYHEAVELGRLFGGLPVSVTPHQVTNEYNTTFTRCFYYLAGKFTPLQVILGAMDTLAREKENA